MKRDTPIKMDVRGNEWKIYLTTEQELSTALNADAVYGIARCHERKIFFTRENLDMPTLRHELIHAYCYENLSFHLELDQSQSQEMVCYMLDRFWDEIQSRAKELKKELTQLGKEEKK